MSTDRPTAERGSDPDADPESVARTIVLNRLSAQPRTRAELEQTLARRQVPADAAARVLDRLEEVRLVDDAAFARAWVESRHAGRGLARRALAHELRRRGVDDEVAQAALEDVDEEREFHAARELVRRKLRGTSSLDRATRLRRLAGMLARKGYSQAIAVRVVREELAAESGDGDAAPDFDDVAPE